MSGSVLGIIHQEYNSEDTANLISAIGITELKKVLERMVNGRSELFLGVYGTDVSEEAHLTLGVPKGAYITGIVMDCNTGAILAMATWTLLQEMKEFRAGM